MPSDLPKEPWHSFFIDLDEVLKEPVVLECFGGFVVIAFYGMPRETIDVDCVSVTPNAEVAHLEEIAGNGSALYRKHGVYLQHVGIANVPENYSDRLVPMFTGAYQRLQLFALDPYDLVLSKLERNAERDRDDLKYLAGVMPLDLAILEERYRSELRPYLANVERHDLTFRLWREILQEL
jgi:Nucleotidyltransferase of unknown function (DUF6036)